MVREQHLTITTLTVETPAVVYYELPKKEPADQRPVVFSVLVGEGCDLSSGVHRLFYGVVVPHKNG